MASFRYGIGITAPSGVGCISSFSLVLWRYLMPIEIKPKHPLYDAALKVHRAGVHLDALEEEVRAFLQKELYVVGTELNPERTHYVVRVRPLLAPSPLFGLIVGDFAQNLRSSLDYLICQLAQLDQSGRPCEERPRTQFPIIDKEADWGSSGIQDMVRRLAPQPKDIVKSIQPYHAGDVRGHALWVIRELSNIDKHRRITGTPFAIEMKFRPWWGAKLFDDGSVEFAVPVNEYSKDEFERQIATQVAFQITGVERGVEFRYLRTVHEIVRDRVFPRFMGFFPDQAEEDEPEINKGQSVVHELPPMEGNTFR